MAYQQIPLNLRLRAEATFDNFIAVGNESIVHNLRQAGEQYIYLWGEQASGKTHLLQALCHQFWLENKSAAYIPLLDDEISEPEILLGLESMELVCLDDLQAISGKANWETAVFNLYNALREEGGRLLVSATTAPNLIGLQLADLTSRLNWGVVFQIMCLQDEAKVTVLQGRAEQLGLTLSREVADYLLKRSPRDMASLFALLNQLDTASLTAQRRLTIPFVRQYL